MIKRNKILAIIPARGGSKGVPRKNIRILGNRPLISHTIDFAKKSKYIDRLILSSDNLEIMDIAKKYGCEVPFTRPPELAKDTATTSDVISHCVDIFPNYDYLVILQPTSPFRNTDDIDAAIEACIFSGASSSVSIVSPDKSPYWMYTINENGSLVPAMQENFISRRQDLPQVYALNGAVYVIKCSVFIDNLKLIQPDTVPYIMPSERSIDIDTEFDLLFAETAYKHFNRAPLNEK